MKERKMLAVDYGASSGRVMMGSFSGEKLSVKELHRFPNIPVTLDTEHGRTMYWDFLRLFHEMKQGILRSLTEGGAESIGVDTWGVDYGLLDRNGRLLSNPVHYRDRRTAGMLEKALKKIDKKEFYQLTGNQFMEINTVFQLMAEQEAEENALERAEHMLLMPDLFQYYLSGEKAAEYTIASTTQMLDIRRRKWADKITDSLGIPGRLLPSIVLPGTRLGTLRPSLEEELGVKNLTVIAVAGHDTQSAMAAVPQMEDDFIFLSCGTWSLFGTELDGPVITEESFTGNITNEGGCGGKVSFLKNIIGLWLIQESRRQWSKEGKEYSFGELEQMALETEPFQSLIDPDREEFLPEGNIPERIRNYCRRTGQKVPETAGEVVRCIDESLALTYQNTLEEISRCTGKTYRAIHLIGGGAQSALLCQMTADACGIPVYAGPVEATVYGNLMMQLLALGEVKDLKEARDILKASVNVKVYEPHDTQQWREWAQRRKENGIKS